MDWGGVGRGGGMGLGLGPRVFHLDAHNTNVTFTVRCITSPRGGSSSACVCTVGDSASIATNLECEGGTGCSVRLSGIAHFEFLVPFFVARTATVETRCSSCSAVVATQPSRLSPRRCSFRGGGPQERGGEGGWGGGRGRGAGRRGRGTGGKEQ